MLQQTCPRRQRRDGQRHRHGTTEHVLHLGGLIKDLVHRDPDEVHEHQIAHRTKSSCGRPYAKADDGLLGDGRVLDSRLTELSQEAVEHVEDAAVARNVLTDEEHIRIGRHGLVHALIEGLDIGKFARGHRKSFRSSDGVDIVEDVSRIGVRAGSGKVDAVGDVSMRLGPHLTELIRGDKAAFHTDGFDEANAVA